MTKQYTDVSTYENDLEKRLRAGGAKVPGYKTPFITKVWYGVNVLIGLGLVAFVGSVFLNTRDAKATLLTMVGAGAAFMSLQLFMRYGTNAGNFPIYNRVLDEVEELKEEIAKTRENLKK